ncbi:Phytanoyl-CoA dioxygenase [Macrophomina phaseolina MS6]|uniref:Phytanoyl-CoA dioxygenase n=1 Tax=Macrophomina phaseolina (strain MS6) TaxID=1126212 RepID=K2SN53_MACPH|nr:Phytanoyl-CoA dioxygenase [Macrophomina phaseolina MS6]
MDFWSSQPRNSLTINKQVGADRRIGETKIDPQYHKYIEHTIEHGYVIIENAFTPAAVDEANAELRRLSATPIAAGPAAAGGRNEFEGLKTRRIYALLNKSRTFDAFALHPAVVALNDFFLDPNWLLSTLHSITSQPGEDSQTLHHDDGAITVPRPHKPFGSVSSPSSCASLPSPWQPDRCPPPPPPPFSLFIRITASRF